MSSRRTAKVAEAIREVVSTTVLFGLKDPRVKNVTVLTTEVSPDLKYARVFVSVRGEEKTQSLSMRGLNSARGFIQSQIADRLKLRYTPILSFVLDNGVKKSVEASALIAAALQESESRSPSENLGDASEDSGYNHSSETDLPEDVPRPD